MTAATFETATLADAISQAARFAPTKGSALDRSAGIVLAIVPGEAAVVRSTDLSVFYRHTLTPISTRGEAAIWRAPSGLLAAVLSGLPMQLGSTVTLADKDDDGFLYIRCGGVKAKVRTIDSNLAFPTWEPFDLAGMGVVEHLADRLAQVGWCTEKKGVDVLTGIHIDGSYLWATNRNEAVRVPLACPVARPITAPLQVVQSVVKDYPEIRVRVGARLELSPDPDVQLELGLYEGAYPAIEGFLEAVLPYSFAIAKGPVLEAIDRLLVIVEGERYPVLKVEFEAEGLLRLTMDDPDRGRLIEEIAVPAVDAFTFFVTPLSLRWLLSSTRQPEVWFHHSADPFGQYRITDDLGFVAAAMPRRVSG